MTVRAVLTVAKFALTSACVDGYVKASPAVKRAILESVEALRREGHECIEFKPIHGRLPNL